MYQFSKSGVTSGLEVKTLKAGAEYESKNLDSADL